MIIKRSIYYFTYIAYKNNLMSHQDIRKMQYGMEVVFNDISKLLIFLLLFGITGQLDKFIFAYLVLFTIRSFSGGLHFYTWLQCFLFSFGFFSLVVLALPNINLINSKPIYIALMSVSLPIIIFFSPMPSKYRPIHNKKRKMIGKLTALILTILWLLLLYFKFNDYMSYGIWTIFLLSIQLIIGHLIKIKAKV